MRRLIDAPKLVEIIDMLSMKHFHRTFFAPGLLCFCLSAFAQVEIPIAYRSLSESDLSKECYFSMAMSTHINFTLWNGLKEGAQKARFMSQMSVASLAAEIWRSKFADFNPEEMRLSMERVSKLSQKESDAQRNYCREVSHKYMELLTPSQQKLIEQRAIERVLNSLKKPNEIPS